MLIELAQYIILVLVVIFLLRPLLPRISNRAMLLDHLQMKRRDRYKEEAKQKRAIIRGIGKEINKTGKRLSKEQRGQIDEALKDFNALNKDFMADTWNASKKIMRETNEESGVFISVKNSTAFYVASMLATPIPAPIFLGISSYILPETSGGNLCLLLLPLPVIGAWLAYNGYKLLQKTAALALCLTINALYASLLLLGAIVMR